MGTSIGLHDTDVILFSSAEVGIVSAMWTMSIATSIPSLFNLRIIALCWTRSREMQIPTIFPDDFRDNENAAELILTGQFTSFFEGKRGDLL